MAWDFELVAGPYGGKTDGPVWDGQGLLFSCGPQNAILRYDPASNSVSEFRRHWQRVRGLAFDSGGILYGCQSGSRRIVRFNQDGSTSPVRARLDGQLHNCPDDLAIDSQGRIWFSDPYDPEPPRGPDIRPFLDHASVLRLERPHFDSEAQGEGRSADEWRLHRMTFDTSCPRGVLLSPDERTLYVADSEDVLRQAQHERSGGAAELRAYPIQDDSTLGDPRVLHRFGADDSGADGMCLDREGNIVACAGWTKGGPGPMIYVVSASGQVVDSQPTPADEPTNCAFGDADLASLYVTTAEGHLFRVRDSGRRG